MNLPYFFGREDSQIDTKGRFVVPSRFRPRQQEQTFYVFPLRPGCMALMTPSGFARFLDEMRRADPSLLRGFSGLTYNVRCDQQGRVALREPLLREAGLRRGMSVVVWGALDRVEVWEPEAWRKRSPVVDTDFGERVSRIMDESTKKAENLEDLI